MAISLEDQEFYKADGARIIAGLKRRRMAWPPPVWDKLNPPLRRVTDEIETGLLEIERLLDELRHEIPFPR